MKPARKGGFPVRWFRAQDGTLIEASLLSVPGGWRYRMAKANDPHGFAFGQVNRNSVLVNRSLSEAAKLMSFEEVQPEVPK